MAESSWATSTVADVIGQAPHPAAPPSDPTIKVWATIDHVAKLGPVATTNIWFGVGAPATRFVIPEPTEGPRTAGLWQTTCSEAFLRREGQSPYREWNFAPSTDWAAYDFADYREKAGEAEVSAPYIRFEDNLTWFALGATIAVDAEADWKLGLSAVLEEKGGRKSYWSLVHPSDKPDFHHPDCFAARLA